MFRTMRRSRQQLSDKEALAMLQNGTSGVLAVAGDDGYPYAVPLSYVFQGGKIYFHCAKSGHKLDAIRRCEKVSFCVIGQDYVVPEEYTTYFRSVIAFGRARVLESEAEIYRAMKLIAEKYAPEMPQDHDRAIVREWDALCAVEITVEHFTGKEAIELVRQKNTVDKCNKVL